MTPEIIKLSDKVEGGLAQRYIMGLNIFPDEHPRYGEFDNPRVDFLREICANNHVAAITGSLRDFGDTPDELFGNSNYRDSYETVRIGCYGGEFYDFNDSDLFPPLLFPRISPDFFDIDLPHRSEDNSLLFSIMYADALALFISEKTANAEIVLRDILNQPFHSKKAFLEATTRLYEVVLVTQADDDYFVCFSHTASSFGLMDDSLTKVTAGIAESDWFKKNSANLAWNDLHCCLVPKS